MNKDDLAYFKKWFSAYVASFRTGDRVRDKTIGLKEAHTRRVCKEIMMIAKSLDLSGDDLLLAEAVALFHDVGRFKQYRDYGTFDDSVSRNHAELGLEELAAHKILSRCSTAENKLIRWAIHFHNVRVLPEEEEAKLVFFAKLLRDADKLDIWRVFVDYYEGRYPGMDSVVVWRLPDEPGCSSTITGALYAQEMAETKHMVTLNDFKLLQISWVFDINFASTFRTIQRRGYVDKIATGLPHTADIQTAVGIAKAYVLAQQFPTSVEAGSI